MEKWKKIPGYSLYEASDMGNIKTFNWKNKGIEKIMSPALDGTGYLRTMLKNDNGKTHTIKVHRIILLTFVGEPKEEQECNHKNGIRSDNRLINLEWVSHSKNLSHSFHIGLSDNKGEKNPCASLTDKEVLEIRRNYQYGKNCKRGQTKQEIADQYNTTFNVIKQLVQGRTWKHLL
jgi:hypothetical protein